MVDIEWKYCGVEILSTFYIHWPFCISKCSYCNFYSRPIKRTVELLSGPSGAMSSEVNSKTEATENRVGSCQEASCGNPSHEEFIDYIYWLDQYKKASAFFKQFSSGQQITSIYFGGGTPSLLPESFVSEIVKHIRANFEVLHDAEITIEANPKTIDVKKAINLKEAGINRISIGVQSIYDEWLAVLGRTSHNSYDAISCVNQMSEVFDNISIDMIYNRPGQEVAGWERELREAMDLFGGDIKHISCYELIIEKGTPLYCKIESGELAAPAASSDSSFFDVTHDVLGENGFEMYEVSNFAKGEEFRGLHNLSYWQYEDFFGIGPGAHSRVSFDTCDLLKGKAKGKIAISQLEDFKMSSEILSDEDILKEKLIMGLRAKCGVAIRDLAGISNIDKKMLKLQENSYIICNCDRAVATYEGLKRVNLIVEYILKD
jgi:oxygen-independent coproporphyrinogen-3 oxidase